MKRLLAALACALIAALAALGGFWSPRPAVEARRLAPPLAKPAAAPSATRDAAELSSASVPESGREPLTPQASAAVGSGAPGQAVYGSLRGPDGPLVAARLELRSREHALIAAGTSGANGDFALAFAEFGRGASLRVEAPGRAPLTAAPLNLVRGRNIQLGELQLDAGVALAGRVLDEHARPIAGAELALALLTVPAGAEAHARATSSASGEFRFEHVPRSRWRIEASAAGFGARALEGESAQASEQLELVLAAPLRLVLQAVDETGAALPSARARLVPLRTELVGTAARADELGRIVFAELGGGDWRAQIEADGHRSAQLQISQSKLLRGPMRVELARWPSVSGRAWQRGHPEAAPHGLELHVRALDAQDALGASSPHARMRIEADGHFEIGGLRPGRYRIEARATCCARALSPPFELEEFQHLDHVELELESGHTIELELRVAGAPLAEAEIHAWAEAPPRTTRGGFMPERGFLLRTARSNSHGNASLQRVPNGPLWLTVESALIRSQDFGPYASPSAVPRVLELEPRPLAQGK